VEHAAREAEIEALVAEYLDHLHDGAYMRRVFANGDVAVSMLATMLGSGDRTRVNRATLVLSDAVLYRYVPRLRELVPRTNLLDVLAANLYASDYGIRRDSIYTLGKLTYPRAAGALTRAFPVYLQRYPLEPPGLLSELFWLSTRARRRRWDYFLAMARSPQYPVRWCVFEAADYGSVGTARRSRDARLYKRLLHRLARDPHPLVRQEARWRLLDARPHLDPRRWGGSTEVLGDRSFELVVIQFSNYLWVSGPADYDLALLHRFAHYVVVEAACTGAPAPVDSEAFARAFEEWAVAADHL
jgi:hypothetical protein